MKNQLIEWLKSEQQNIDKAIASAGEKYYKKYHNNHQTEPYFQYDLKQCHIESYNLIHGKDLCYDRPNTAFTYSLWYQPRRINTFLSFFLNKVLEHEGQHIEVFDLGAGTGAIQWSLGLIYVGLKKLGKNPPRITVINIDTSPFMLNYNKEYLWKEFRAVYPEIDKNFIDVYVVNSWNNEKNLETSNPILAASYLFDASDNKDEIANDFKSLVNKYRPNTVLLLTSRQPKKMEFLEKLKEELKKQGYAAFDVRESNLIFDQTLTHINKIRTDLGKKLNISELQRNASWTDSSHLGLVLKKTQSEITFTFESLDIYNPQIIVRRKVTLNDKQKKAAINTGAPSIIVGPAGCGKSIVITEKIKNIVEESNYSPDLKILVTTFNKGLIGKLAEWLKDLLDSTKYTFKYDTNFYGYNDESSHFIFKGSSDTNIRLLHFDMLPKLLGGVKYRRSVDLKQHFSLLREIIQNVKQEEKINNDQFDNILNPDFLFEEYHRVIYGLQVSGSEDNYLKISDDYLKISRKGRGNNSSLPKNSSRRKLVFKCLNEYASRIHNKGIESFTTRRQYFYHLLKRNQVQLKYDYILVDEFQDCTRADIDIFFRLLKPDKQNNFTLAGDLAQSIQLGTSARVESIREVIREGRDLDNIQWHYLDGSYRLPVRISEAIKNISDAINTRFNKEKAASIITPYKGSPPGARPIVVYGKDYVEVADKLKNIFMFYKIFDIDKVTILEKDEPLLNELKKRNIDSETDTIFRLKGLEKNCVLWSTRIPLESENEVPVKSKNEVLEITYTILTRTSCILIIAITDDTQDVYKKILGLLNRERLIMWDSETEQKFATFCEKYEPQTIKDED